MKNTKYLIIPVLMLLSASATAELYKCTINGKVAYQAKPCRDSSSEKRINIELSNPEQNAKALEKFREIEAQHESKKEQLAREAKEQREAALRAAEVGALQRNADAQSSQSEAMQKQVKELDSADNVRGAITGAKPK